MQHRRVRLGDILDDYCPRERRVTNHAVVAMLEDEIRLTRCTTCESEHAYKAARVPPKRRKKTDLEPVVGDRPRESAGPAAVAPPAVEEEPTELGREESPPEVESVRRPLIRATLKRPEGVAPPPRPAPVFTVRQTHGRSSGLKDAWGPRATSRHGRSDGATSRHGHDRVGAPRSGGLAADAKSAWSRQAGGHRTDRAPFHTPHPGKGTPRRRSKGRHK